MNRTNQFDSGDIHYCTEQDGDESNNNGDSNDAMIKEDTGYTEHTTDKETRSN